MKQKKIAIIGAGPIGLETALYANRLGYGVEIFEQSQVGANMLDWGHVRLFSPFKMNHSPLGATLIREQFSSWQEPNPECFMTGKEFVDSYLRRLSQLSEIVSVIHTETKVTSMAREGILKSDLIGDAKRPSYPFRLLTKKATGEEAIHTADIVIDATGVYGNPNWLGDGGIPGLGELASRPFIDYKMPDILGKDRPRFAGKKTLVVGAGYSAATVVCDLQKLIVADPATALLWVIRDQRARPIAVIEDDPLTPRAGLSEKANSVVDRTSPTVQFRNNTTIDSVYYSESNGTFTVGLRSNNTVETVEVHRVLAAVGFGPDNSIYRELQVHECFATRGPMKLAAALLDSSSEDCLTRESAGAETLKNPEPNFFIIGNKSYGRNPTFLIRVGLSQIVEVFSLITGEESLNLYEPQHQEVVV